MWTIANMSLVIFFLLSAVLDLGSLGSLGSMDRLNVYASEPAARPEIKPETKKDERPVAGQVVSVTGKALFRSGNEASDAKGQTLKVGDVIRQGDVINTSSSGSVKLLLQDKSILDIGPSALFDITQYKTNHGGDRNVDIQMPYGQVRAAITRKLEGGGSFKIKTKTVTMGVRGTEFVVMAPLDEVFKATEKSKPEDKIAGKSDGTSAKPGSTPAPSANKTSVIVIQGNVDVEQKPEAGARNPASGKLILPKKVSLSAGQKIVADSGPSAAPIKIMAVSTEELKQTVSVTKIDDNTFKKSITIDTSTGKTDGGISNATQVAIQGAVTTPVTNLASAPAAAGNSGFIGTFGSGAGLVPPPVIIPIGGLAHVKVVISR